MSRIISFAWTTPALLAGQKTCTRRDWDHDYARRFTAGEEVLAFNRSPRARGVQLARIRLTADPVYQPMYAMPDVDYYAEGFAWMAEHPGSVPKTIDRAPFDHENLGWPAFRAWQRADKAMWVIRFELVAYHGANVLAHVPPAQLELIRASLPAALKPLAAEAFGIPEVAL